MKALLIGAGGIGQNVYLPQLMKKGFTVDTVDSVLPATYDNAVSYTHLTLPTIYSV